MAKQVTSANVASPDFNEEASSRRAPKPTSITNYVSDVLAAHGRSVGQPIDLTQTQIEIGANPSTQSEYVNVSAFRPYQFGVNFPNRTDSQHQEQRTAADVDELRDPRSLGRSSSLGDSIAELNLDPNPIHEEQESQEQVYKQKVYLRQLQPPTPQPIEIQVQEVLVKPQTPKPPIHVRVGQREPRTPSPIVIKTAPPPPPPPDSDQPIVYTKYVPPPKQQPQQIIIHRYPEMPPKPRPIVVEQWLPYKPAPKRIIKQSLPREALQTPSAPHNIIISYSKPRALIEVELVRLPVVKIDPHTYEQMSAAGQQQLVQHPTFQHEKDYLFGNKSTHTTHDKNDIDWRI